MKKYLIIIILALINNCLNASGQKLLHPYNLDFEIGETGKLPPAWSVPLYATNNGYTAGLTDLNPKTGKYCFELRKETNYVEGVYGSVMQSIGAENYKGKTIRFRGAVRAEIASPKGSAHLWLRVHVPGEQMGFFDLMENNPVVINDWAYYEITGKIDDDAVSINYGLLLRGTGKAWIDHVTFEIIDTAGTAVVPPSSLSDKGAENMAAFAKLFGYARYFYAGNESQENNWEIFALTGVENVENAENSEELAKVLTDLFKPIAPAFNIFTDNIKIKRKKSKSPGTSEGLRDIALAWKHLGPSTGMKSAFFSSNPVNVFRSQREKEGSAIQIINAESLRGKEITFSCFIRANVVKPAGQAQLWLRIDDNNDKQVVATGMFDNPVTENKWKNYTVKALVPESAKLIRLGLVVIGDGEVFFDDATLKVTSKDTAYNQEIKNPGFEEGISGELVRGWRFSPSSEKAGYNAKIVHSNTFKGKSSLQISSDENTRIKLPLPGEIFSPGLGAGLGFETPLTLAVDSLHTLPYPPKEIKLTVSKKHEDFSLTANDRSSRLAVVIILWNILKQFSLYQHDSLIWDNALTESLKKAAVDSSSSEFLETLSILTEKLNDSQARVWQEGTENLNALPFLWAWIDNSLIITDISEKRKDIKIGSEIIEIDGTPASQYLSEKEKAISAATPQWKRLRAMAVVRTGKPESHISLKIKSPDGKVTDKIIERNIYPNELTELRPPAYSKLEGNFCYIDLTRIRDKELKDIIDSLNDVNGIIFDLRGISMSTEHFLGFLTSKKLKSFDWEIPVYTYPDQKFVSKKIITNEIKARDKFAGKKIFFLQDERAIGYSETILALVKNYALGTIIGSPTAGTAGEIMPFRLPAGYNVSMTAIRVIDANQKELYGNGIQPDVPANPSKESIKAGRDAAFDKAVELIKK